MRRLLFVMAILLTCLVQAQVTETDNIQYTLGGGSPQLLDLFEPAVTPPQGSPAIVFVHGGGWTAGSKADYDAWGQYYAGMGYVCVSINYRLAPAFVWPAQIDDTQAAVRWVRKNAATLHVDPHRVGAVGASAGGHLVLLLGQLETLNDVDPNLHGVSSKVNAVCDYFGPSDFSIPSEWNPGIWSLITSFVGVPWSPTDPTYQMASPLTHVDSANAPTLIFQGDADPVVPVAQSRRIVALKRSRHATALYLEVHGEGHGFNTSDTWGTIYTLNKFFAVYLAPPFLR